MIYLFLMAGEGSRFKSAGYTDDKPMILVNGERMVELVIRNRITTKLVAEYNPLCIFVCQKKFIEKYKSEFEKIVKKYCINYIIRTVDKLTEGATCTALTIEDLINNEEKLIIDDIDHVAEDGHIYRGIKYFEKTNAFGGFWYFISTDPKYSFIKVENGYTKDVVEKEAVSMLANTGTYYWQRGADFVKYAKEMIAKNDRVRNEFYIAPVYRYPIVDGKPISFYCTNLFSGLGVPADLQLYEGITRKYGNKTT